MAGPKTKVKKALDLLNAGYPWKTASELADVPLKHIYKLLEIKGDRKK